MQNVLQLFRKMLLDNQILLNTEIENFIPRLSKKNGRPKTDMPCNLTII